MNALKNFFGLILSMGMLAMIGCNYTEEAQPAFTDLHWEEELGLTADVEVEIDETDAELFVSENGLRSKCLQLVFPVVIEFPDGSIEEVGDGRSAKAAIRDYYEANGRGDRPVIQLPFMVETRNGDMITIEERGEVKDLLKECQRKARYVRLRACFDLVYPVGVILPNGDVINMDNPSQMKAFLKGWRMHNKGTAKRPRIQTPFQVETKNGDLVSIGSKDDMKAVIKDCID